MVSLAFQEKGKATEIILVFPMLQPTHSQNFVFQSFHFLWVCLLQVGINYLSLKLLKTSWSSSSVCKTVPNWFSIETLDWLEAFYKNIFLLNFANFTGKYLQWSTEVFCEEFYKQPFWRTHVNEYFWFHK